MIHIRNSKPNSIFLLENEGVPSGTLTDFNETIIDGSLCIDITNQNMYLLKSGTWTLVNGGGGGGSAYNGLTDSSSGIKLGGTLSESTNINVNSNPFTISNGNPIVNFTNRELITGAGFPALDWSAYQLKVNGGFMMLDWQYNLLRDGANTSLDWFNRTLNSTSGAVVANWKSNLLNMKGDIVFATASNKKIFGKSQVTPSFGSLQYNNTIEMAGFGSGARGINIRTEVASDTSKNAQIIFSPSGNLITVQNSTQQSSINGALGSVTLTAQQTGSGSSNISMYPAQTALQVFGPSTGARYYFNYDGLGIEINSAYQAKIKTSFIASSDKTFELPNKSGTIALLDDVSAATAGSGLISHNNIIDIGGNIRQNTRLDLQDDYNLAIDNFKNFNISGSNFIANTKSITINSTTPIFSNGALTSIRTNTFDPDMGNGFCFGVKNHSTSGGGDYLNYLNMSDYYGTVLYQSRFAENGSLSVGYGNIVAQVVSGSNTSSIGITPTDINLNGSNITISGSGVLNNSTFTTTLNWSDRQTFNSSNQITVDWENAALYNQGGNISLDWEGHIMNDYSGNFSLDANNRSLLDENGKFGLLWNTRVAYDDNNFDSINWQNRILYSDETLQTISLDWKLRQLSNTNSGVLLNWSGDDVTFPTTGAITLPVGTTAQQPSSPVAGMIRFNTDINKAECYDGTVWQPLW